MGGTAASINYSICHDNLQWALAPGLFMCEMTIIYMDLPKREAYQIPARRGGVRFQSLDGKYTSTMCFIAMFWRALTDTSGQWP